MGACVSKERFVLMAGTLMKMKPGCHCYGENKTIIHHISSFYKKGMINSDNEITF